MSIRDKVNEQLEKSSSISSTDIAEMATETEAREDNDKPVKVENDSGDPLTKAASKGQPYETLGKKRPEAEKFGGYNLGLMKMDEEPEITDEDKENFMNCLVDGKPFIRKFSLFGGKLTGVFRSRSTAQSTAIISEVNRRMATEKNMAPMSYAATLRHATLAFQVAELNGVEYPYIDEGLKASYDLETSKVSAPTWWKLVDKYASMQEGTEQAIYTSMLEFERVYWTLVKNAANQNFWNPGDSTTE
jgi:hypothetical protein